MHNGNQPRTANGRFGTVPQSESDVELTDEGQLPEWQVRNLARPGGPAHTARATDPEAARQQVMDTLGITVPQVRERFASLLKVASVGKMAEQQEPEQEIKGWFLEFVFTSDRGGRGASYQTTTRAPEPESAKQAVYDEHRMNLWQRVTAEDTMSISQIINRSLYPVR